MTKETDPSIVFHTDATQSVGKISLDMEKEYRHVEPSHLPSSGITFVA